MKDPVARQRYEVKDRQGQTGGYATIVSQSTEAPGIYREALNHE